MFILSFFQYVAQRDFTQKGSPAIMIHAASLYIAADTSVG